MVVAYGDAAAKTCALIAFVAITEQGKRHTTDIISQEKGMDTNEKAGKGGKVPEAELGTEGKDLPMAIAGIGYRIIDAREVEGLGAVYTTFGAKARNGQGIIKEVCLYGKLLGMTIAARKG